MAGRKKKKIIDVGDQPAEKDPDGQDAEDEGEEEEEKGADDVDPDLAEDAANAALAAEDESVGDLEDVEVPQPKASRGGSLARRDPMAAYMNEVRRYPLLTPEEEKSLATRLVEHGDIPHPPVESRRVVPPALGDDVARAAVLRVVVQDRQVLDPAGRRLAAGGGHRVGVAEAEVDDGAGQGELDGRG